MMCARIGKVTGQGLAANFKRRFPRWLLFGLVTALLAPNTINIGADLAWHSRCGGKPVGDQFAPVCGGFRAPDFLGDDPTPLSPDSKCAQVTGAGALRLPDNRVCGGSGLGGVARATFIPSMPHTGEEQHS
jgi:hypothetical protein